MGYLFIMSHVSTSSLFSVISVTQVSSNVLRTFIFTTKIKQIGTIIINIMMMTHATLSGLNHVDRTVQ